MATNASKDLVDELVHQFTDPYAFYRELIQNSIDAGSSRIEVTLAYRPTSETGLMTATVQDWGEGMNRRIIDDYLLTKFRSSKENDLTKIGKYGIGFVSIFSLAPDAVTVDTGRDGESWRVLFKKDRSYELLRANEAFEGTRITLHKQLPAAAYSEHVKKSREALARWCRHSEVEVTFSAGGPDGSAPPDPVSMHEAVTVDAPFQVEHREEGLHIVAGPTRIWPAITGFYNRGLTLLETNEDLLPGVALKIVSRTLEHTLTRDNVGRDAHFQKALAAARTLVDGPLLAELPEQLRKAAERPDGKETWRALFRYAGKKLPKSKLWLRAPGGGAVKASTVKGELVVSPTATAVSKRLLAAGTPVIECEPHELFIDNDLHAALGTTTARGCDAVFTYAEPPTTQQPHGFTAALTELLKHAGWAVAGVTVAEVRGAGQTSPFIFIEALGRPISWELARERPAQRKPATLCLNAAHAQIEGASDLMERAPRLSALLMARVVLVRHGQLDEATDAALTAWALQ